jgi:hypothetical protein
MSPKALVAVGICLIVLLVAAVLLWLRFNSRRQWTPGDLAYPCLRVHDGRSWELISSEAELKLLGSGFYMNRRQDPLLVDSQLRVFEMSKLTMNGSELSLMVTGPRTIQVQFDLIPAAGNSSQRAKQLVEELLHDTEGELSPARQQELAEAVTFEQLLKLLRSDP